MQINDNKQSIFFSRMIGVLILLAALVPWFIVRIQQALNPDTLWLCEVLHRHFGGCRLSDCAFELNPPPNLLIYTLPVLGQDWFGLPLHYAIFGQTLLILAGFTWATYKILSAWDKLRPYEIFIIIAAYVLLNTIGTSINFSQRDQLIGMALVPFVLMQLTLTFNLPQAKNIKWPIFLCGSVFILIKPHHGLLPSLMLLHRAVLRRDLSILRYADFLSLAAMTLLYLISAAIMFPDYANNILPDVFTLYGSGHQWGKVSGLIYAMAGFCLATALAAALIPCRPFIKRIILLLAAAAAISVIPYFVQGMGFYYHALPALAFLWPAAALAIFCWLSGQTRCDIAVSFTAIFLVAFAYTFAPLNIGYPRYKDYAHLPLTKLLKEECPKEKRCSFFMFDRDLGIMNQTAYYTGVHNASRFADAWFLPEIINSGMELKQGRPSRLNKNQLEYYTRKYTAMVAEDLARNKPDVLVIWKVGGNVANFDFIDFFSVNKNFVKEVKHYHRIKTVKLSYNDYFHDTAQENKALDYDVYRRVSP